MILLLGGTAEARELAARLHDDVRVVSSLAGRVARPRLPVGEVRVGGFGGIAGLTAWLREHEVVAVVDATHPFAATISANAVAACAEAGVPLLRLARPGWEGEPDARAWTWVDDVPAAAAATARIGTRPLVTIGRQGLEAFVTTSSDAAVLARVVDPPAFTPPPSWRILLDRGPYTLAGELALLREHDADVLVTKDSGGIATRAKLDAARELGLPVVIVRRPEPAGAVAVSEVAAAEDWVRRLL